MAQTRRFRSMLYTARNRPFELPETGEIDVKEINHYSDEILKVYEPTATG